VSPQYLFECKGCDQRAIIVAEITKTNNVPACVECGQSMTRRYDFGAVKFVGKGFASNDIQ
jgi:predicted nucleic acid-binding Zn ribbon protein